MADAARARKVADRIHETVARLLQGRIKDPRLGFVTVTDVRVTGDLQQATIFYTVYGSDEDRRDSAAALNSAKGLIRSEVGRALGIRLTPSLTFQLDALPTQAKSFDDAKSQLQKAGFTGKITKEDMKPADEAADAVKGQVQESDPVLGQKAAPDHDITLKVATGTSPVPDFTGKTLDEAQSLATNAGFQVTLKSSEGETSQQDAGKVFKQSPDEGTALDRKTGKITVTIAKAAPTTAKVPNMIGMDESQAQQAFKSAGFSRPLRIRQVEQPGQQTYGRVSAQNFDADTELPRNTEDVEVTIPTQPAQNSQEPTQTPSPSPTPLPSPPPSPKR